MAKINIRECEVFEESTFEFKIENVIYNFILEKIKSEKAVTADDYAKTCSIKARRGIETRVQKGSSISSKAAYRYKIEADNATGIRKHRLEKEKWVNWRC